LSPPRHTSGPSWLALCTMTDRFYPVGLPAEKDCWKTTYEVQNEMRAFERSAYPPGCAVHLPGSREKFGFSTPGPLAHRLANPDLCLTEETDHPNPRAHLAVPRYQVPNDSEVFHELDVPEMQQSYKSPVATMSFSKGMNQSMSRSVSLPSLQKTVSRLQDPHAPVHKLECGQFSYFVPKEMARDGPEKLYTRNLSKLQKENRLTMPWGDGTGFRTQNAQTDWWPKGHYHPGTETAYRENHKKPPFFRMSPLAQHPGQQEA